MSDTEATQKLVSAEQEFDLMRVQLSPMELEDLYKVGDRAGRLVDQLRKTSQLPNRSKVAPNLSSDRVAALCGLTKSQMAYRIKTTSDLPTGIVGERGGRREFTIEEAQAWARSYRAGYLRPENQKGQVLATGFFKGGVSKTSTAMILAQGLSMRGHKVLVIDMDPQGSLTSLHGIRPDDEIGFYETLTPILTGESTDIFECIRPTYWPGIDLIPASSHLFSAEFALPMRQYKNPMFKFWDVLSGALEPAKEVYDVIIIDTPPALSYVTFNAFYAADGMLVPHMLDVLNLATSSQFWSMFHEFSEVIAKDLVDAQGRLIREGHRKKYDFVKILATKVDTASSGTAAVRSWMQALYGERLMTSEIPETAVTKSLVNHFQTPFDVQRYEGDSRTYRRAIDAYDHLIREVEGLLVQVWAKRATEAKEQKNG